MIKRTATRALPALLLVVASCGSTLRESGTQVVADASDRPASSVVVGTSEPGDGSGGAASEAGSVPSTGGDNSTAGDTTDGQPSTDGNAETPATRGADGSAPSAQGSASDAPIRVGVVGVDIAALAAAFGADGSQDIFGVSRAFIDYMNADGGVSGRQIEAEYVTVDVAEDYNSAGQRVCETFTQDNPVDLVVSQEFGQPVMLSCLAQHGIAVFDTLRWTDDRSHVDHPNWFVPGAIRVDRYSRAAVDVAVEQGVLSPGDKLGVLFEDCPWGQRTFQNVVRPAASDHGIETEQATVKCIENLVSDLGPVTNQSRAAVLRFRSANVTHVMVISAAEGYIMGQFTQAASEQRWYPQYLVTTHGFPYNNSDPDATVHFAPDAVPNMTGIGFLPYLDVGKQAQPANPTQDTLQAECRRADETMGNADAEGEPTKWQFRSAFYSYCDVWFSLRDVLESNGVSFAVPDVASGYAAVLDSTPSSLLVGGRFGRSGDRLDGVGFVRPFAFDPSTDRFAYSGQPRPVR